MSEHAENKDANPDLFDVLETLWTEKVILALFALAGGILAFVIIHTTEPRHESKITITSRVTFQEQIASPFKTKISEWFFEQEHFEHWRAENPETVLKFNALAPVKYINGIEFQSQGSNSLVTLNEHTLIIYSNDSQIINDVFQYVEFLNKQITNKHRKRLTAELENRRNEVNQFMDSKTIVLNAQSLDAHAVLLANIANLQYQDVYKVSAPSEPVEISDRRLAVLISSMLGSTLFGMIWVFFKNAYAARRV